MRVWYIPSKHSGDSFCLVHKGLIHTKVGSHSEGYRRELSTRKDVSKQKADDIGPYVVIVVL